MCRCVWASEGGISLHTLLLLIDIRPAELVEDGMSVHVRSVAEACPACRPPSTHSEHHQPSGGELSHGYALLIRIGAYGLCRAMVNCVYEEMEQTFFNKSTPV